MDWILDTDRELFLFLNGLHTEWLDPLMMLFTQTQFWVPLYLFLIYLIFKNFGNEGWFVLAGVVVTILLADQITSSLMKPFFARLRPSHEPSLAGLVHLVDGYAGGRYGFASSHAANTFGTAWFIWKLFGTRYRWIGLMFVWCTLMTYTRVYLGVHYPGDVIVGALVGIGSGAIGWQVYQALRKKFKSQDLTVDNSNPRT
ncbi:MAG TPA: phosphatase PAP2 family protein [Cytophagales bacterium]|nr:phosphatase PAP2 family protein [Cytophagales bacterium]